MRGCFIRTARTLKEEQPKTQRAFLPGQHVLAAGAAAGHQHGTAGGDLQEELTSQLPGDTQGTQLIGPQFLKLTDKTPRSKRFQAAPNKVDVGDGA